MMRRISLFLDPFVSRNGKITKNFILEFISKWLRARVVPFCVWCVLVLSSYALNYFYIRLEPLSMIHTLLVNTLVRYQMIILMRSRYLTFFLSAEYNGEKVPLKSIEHFYSYLESGSRSKCKLLVSNDLLVWYVFFMSFKPNFLNRRLLVVGLCPEIIWMDKRRSVMTIHFRHLKRANVRFFLSELVKIGLTKILWQTKAAW